MLVDANGVTDALIWIIVATTVLHATIIGVTMLYVNTVVVKAHMRYVICGKSMK